MNIDNMKIEIEEGPDYFFRHSCCRLRPYGEMQEGIYGKKENLISRLENRYGISLGKNVRVLRNDVILFFPTRVGLSGKLAFCDWDVFDAESHSIVGLISMKPCEPIQERMWEKLLHSLGLYESLFSGGIALFAYQYRDLYIVLSETLGTINFTRITDPANPYCMGSPADQEEFDLL